MKFLFMKGFNEEERDSYKGIIASNTVGSMRVLVAAAADMSIELKEKEAAERFMNDTSGTHFAGSISPSIGRDIKLLWGDQGIKTAYTRSAEFQLNDSAGYYFDSIDRLMSPDYTVTKDDVLRSRTKVFHSHPTHTHTSSHPTSHVTICTWPTSIPCCPPHITPCSLINQAKFL